MRSPLFLLLPVLLIAGWEVAAYFIDNPFILPSLTTVIPILLHPFSTEYTLGTGSLVENAATSLFRVASGFLLAAAIAIPLGIGMGRSSFLNDFLDSTIELLRPIPSPCLGSPCPGLVQDRVCLHHVHHFHRGVLSHSPEYHRRGKICQENMDRSG